jgi:hypothetical protein
LASIPLIWLPSHLGKIEYSYPEGFLEMSCHEQYFYILGAMVNHVLQTIFQTPDTSFAELPSPVKISCKILIPLISTFEIGFSSVLLVKGIGILWANFRRLYSEKGRLLSKELKEVKYDCLLSSMWRRGKE